MEVFSQDYAVMYALCGITEGSLGICSHCRPYAYVTSSFPSLFVTEIEAEVQNTEIK